MIKIKRVYEKAEKGDGYRILVDRLWPRGISKQKAKINLWLKEIAPNDNLRKWFSHKPERWPEFQKRYKAEIKKNSEVLDELRKIIKKNKKVTLLYAAKDEEHNNAVALLKILKR